MAHITITMERVYVLSGWFSPLISCWITPSWLLHVLLNILDLLAPTVYCYVSRFMVMEEWYMFSHLNSCRLLNLIFRRILHFLQFILFVLIMLVVFVYFFSNHVVARFFSYRYFYNLIILEGLLWATSLIFRVHGYNVLFKLSTHSFFSSRSLLTEIIIDSNLPHCTFFSFSWLFIIPSLLLDSSSCALNMTIYALY